MTDEQETSHAFARSRSNGGLGDGTDRLCRVLYGRDARPSDYLAAQRIAESTNVLAKFMFEHGFSTGHGDSVGELLSEFSWQLAELRAKVPNNLN